MIARRIVLFAAWSWSGIPVAQAQDSCKSQRNCKDCLALSCAWYGWLAGCQETTHQVEGFHRYSSTSPDFADQVCQRASDCEVANTCEECLEASCIWYGKGTCIDSAATNIPENQLLYQLDGPGKTTSTVCAQHAQDQQADRLCRTKTNCSECTGTNISDDAACLWYERSGYCRAHGNGESYCLECANRNNDMNTCYLFGKISNREECHATLLADGIHTCEWDTATLGTCEPSTCKHGHPLRDQHQQEDAKLCSHPTDCATCQETLLTDGKSTCVWYEPVRLKPGEEPTSLCGYPGEYETVCHDCSNCHPPMPKEGFLLLDGLEGKTATSEASLATPPMDRTRQLLLGGFLVWVSLASVLELSIY